MEERIELEKQIVILIKENEMMVDILKAQQNFLVSVQNTLDIIQKAISTLQDEKIKELKAAVAENERVDS